MASEFRINTTPQDGEKHGYKVGSTVTVSKSRSTRNSSTNKTYAGTVVAARTVRQVLVKPVRGSREQWIDVFVDELDEGAEQ